MQASASQGCRQETPAFCKFGLSSETGLIAVWPLTGPRACRPSPLAGQDLSAWLGWTPRFLSTYQALPDSALRQGETQKVQRQSWPSF